MMLFNYCGRIILLIICLINTAYSHAEQDIANRIDLSYTQLQQLEQNNFKLLGLLQIDDSAGVDFPLMEFSGLAWDKDEKTLIILSDRGFLIHTRPIFNNGHLDKLKLLSYHYLRDANGKKLSGDFADSEGLALLNANNNIKGDTELIVSFERQPRIIQYKHNGEFLSKHPIKNVLNNIANYEGANKSLEAITLHKHFKMITGPERPLLNSDNDYLFLYDLNKNSWKFTPEENEYGSLVGMTTLPDSRVVILERIFSSIFAGLSNVIHIVELDQGKLQQRRLVKLVSTEHHFNDNFEGISWHKDKRFFMISDDNDNVLQRNLLVYFEIPNLNDTTLNTNNND